MADTSEIVGVVDVQAAPGKADAVIEAFAACTRATHAEDGCIAYALHRDNADPEHFMLVERWRSQADVDAHMNEPHTSALLAFAGAPGNLAQPPTLSFGSALGLGDPVKGTL